MPAETPAPHRTSLTSSMRRVGTPARYISMMASSTLVSRLLQRSMTAAVAKRMPLSLGILSATRPDVVVNPRSSVRSYGPAPTSWSASSSSIALMVSSMVFLTSSRSSDFTASSSNDTIGLDMACLLA